MSARDVKAPPRIRRSLYLILGVLAGLGPFSIDMYLPALPEIGASLKASPGAMQMTVTAFLVGLIFGPVIVGPISDAVGRRPPILVSLIVYSLISLLLAAAGSVEMMIGLRVAQAACGGTSMSLVRSMVRDLLSGDAMARAMSILMMVLLGAPIVAPFFGGALLLVWGWRSIFVVLAVIGALMFVAAWRWLPETLPPELRRPLDLGSSVRGYLSIIRSRETVAYAITGGAVAAVLFCYLAASPFIYIDYYGFDEQWFGALFGISVVGAWLAQVFNIRYVQAIGYGRLVKIGSVLLVGLATVLLWVTQTDFGGHCVDDPRSGSRHPHRSTGRVPPPGRQCLRIRLIRPIRHGSSRHRGPGHLQRWDPQVLRCGNPGLLGHRPYSSVCSPPTALEHHC